MESLKQLATAIGETPVTLPSGRVVVLPEWVIRFPEASPGKLSPDVLASTYTSKPLVRVDGVDVFGELAIVRVLKNDGWLAAWADTYHGKFWYGMPHETDPVQLPSEPKAIYDRIARHKGSASGCFDVIGWRDGHVVFLEYKGPSDRPNRNEPSWIESAVDVGVIPDNLIFIAARSRASTRPSGAVRRARSIRQIGRSDDLAADPSIKAPNGVDFYSPEVERFTDDGKYREWILRNPGGYVVATGRNPARGKATLHITDCTHIDRNNNSLAGPNNPKFCSTSRQALRTAMRHLGRPAGHTWKECPCV